MTILYYTMTIYSFSSEIWELNIARCFFKVKVLSLHMSVKQYFYMHMRLFYMQGCAKVLHKCKKSYNNWNIIFSILWSFVLTSKKIEITNSTTVWLFCSFRWSLQLKVAVSEYYNWGTRVSLSFQYKLTMRVSMIWIIRLSLKQDSTRLSEEDWPRTCTITLCIARNNYQDIAQ